MQKVLVINHHSVADLPSTVNSFDDCKSILDKFFGTWQLAVNTKVSEEFVVCDPDLWMMSFCDGKTMHDYISSHGRTNSSFIYQLLKVTKRTSIDYFTDDVLEVIAEANACVSGHEDAQLVGCVSMSDGAVLLSLVTTAVWGSNKIDILWRPENVKDKFPFLCDYCDNFSEKSHVSTYVSEIEVLAPITRERFNSNVPCSIITDKFWSWFEALEREVQDFLISKARFCARQGWTARRRSPFQSLVGTRNGLAEIRAWPPGKTLRIYVKKESNDRVLFLAGSDKDGQDEMIAAADEYYGTYGETF